MEDEPCVQPAMALVERLDPMDRWVLNTYSACDISCTYCITRAQGRSLPRVPRRHVRAEVHRQLDAVGSPDHIVVGTYADAYPNAEPDLGVTREAVHALVERRQDFIVITKGTALTRDIDLFLEVKPHLQISIPIVDQALSSVWEPRAPSVADRLAAVQELKEAGLRVSIQCAPWIPGISDVAALREQVRGYVGISVTPLRLPHHLWETPTGRRFDQSEVNEAYRLEYERASELPLVRWSRPPAEDGAPPHIVDQLGRSEIGNWEASPSAPLPGPDYFVSTERLRTERREARRAERA